MENRPPHISTANQNTDTDRSHWRTLPTLSQLTRNNNSNQPKSTFGKPNTTLMDIGKGNVNGSGSDDLWEGRGGLLTPPSSQDATKMLISPPPEETLRMSFGGKGGHRRQGSTGKNQPPSTPSLLVTATRHATNSNPKRKRPGVVTPLSTTASSPTQSLIMGTPTPTTIIVTDDVDNDQPPEATPNPKPRKPPKRHTRTQSLDSPTRKTFTRTSGYQEPLLATTPTKSRSKSPSKSQVKRVLIQSPHASNPDADFMPPIPVSSSHLSVSASARRRSRSATPIPPYEPPKDVFTPPREVTISPPQPPPSRSRRKSQVKPSTHSGSVWKGKGTEANRMEGGWVKKEPPEIDWTKPMPPPSPGDDPLLLSGKPKTYQSRAGISSSSPSKGRARASESENETEQFSGEGLDLGSPGLMDLGMGPEPSSTDFSDVPELPVFDLDPNPAYNGYEGGWSDSDSDVDNEMAGEGEYTGKFTMMTVKTKADPPTSGTRGRMDEWGRPISPFPGAFRNKRATLPRDSEFEDEEMDELPMIMDGEEVVEERVAKDEEMVGPSSACGNEEPDISLESAIDMENEQTLEEDEQPAYNEDHSLVETAQDALRQLHDLKDPHGITTLADDLDGEGGVSIATDSIDESFERERSIIEEEEEEEANIDRELSCEPGCNIDDEEEDEGSGTNHIHFLGDEDKHDFDRSRSIVNRQYNCSPSGRWDKPLRPSDFGEHVFPAARTQALEYETEENIRDEAEEGSSSGEESESVGENVVTITSSDPLAAARAAAILKLHDYDHLPRTLLKRRRLSHLAQFASNQPARRKSAMESGIRKFSAGTGKSRRSTLGGMIGDRVFIPGSPIMTLPELLTQAEVRLEKAESGAHETPLKISNLDRDPFKTPGPRGACAPSWRGGNDMREWTKDDWKQLDACFTDERLDVAEKVGFRGGRIANVDDVQIKNVVSKFVEMMGGMSVVETWGSAWDSDSLESRARALQKKQRSGNVAPPTPGRQSPALSRLTIVPPKAHSNHLPVDLDPSQSDHNGSAIECQSSGKAGQPSFTPTEKTSPGISKRVKGFFNSYLPILSKPTIKPSKSMKPQSSQPGLPLPPPEVLGKARGPIFTPIRPLPTKAIPPKEQVHLQHPPSPKKAFIQRPAKPQRLVELHPLPPSIAAELLPIQRNRRSSGGSVKELAKTFEALDQDAMKKPEIKRVRSNGSFARPAWKP